MGRSVIECWGSDGSPAVAAGAMTGAKICLTFVERDRGPRIPIHNYSTRHLKVSAPSRHFPL